VRHSDNKFDYDNQGIAHRKHIVVNRIRYIRKESNNLEDNLTDIEEPDYLEYENIEDLSRKNAFKLDISDRDSLKFTLDKLELDTIIVAAALIDVDK